VLQEEEELGELHRASAGIYCPQFRAQLPRIARFGFALPDTACSWPGDSPTAAARGRRKRLGRAEPDKGESGLLTPKLALSAWPAADSLHFGFADPDF
jgi:hypothetical protein